MSKIIGVGTDIENVSRFKKSSYKENVEFYQKVFSEKEIKECLQKSDPAQSFAARFSAKEAIIKAINFPIFFSQIEITSEKSPEVVLKGSQFQNIKIQLSLSHTEEFALAFVIATEK